jgi:hypothetical protein
VANQRTGRQPDSSKPIDIIILRKKRTFSRRPSGPRRYAPAHAVTELDEAVVTSDAAQARHLVDAAAADGLRAVDPYIAPVKLTRDGEVLPGNLRERIRLGGPTIDLPVTFGI